MSPDTLPYGPDADEPAAGANPVDSAEELAALPGEQRIADLVARVELPSAQARAAAEARQLRLTKPAGALGRLEELSIWWCAVSGDCPAGPAQRPRLVIFAGDHGIVTAAHTSAYPADVTAQMVLNFLAGGAAANVLAERAGVGLRVVDMSVDIDWEAAGHVLPAEVTAHKVRRGSEPLDRRDALTRQQALDAVCAGADIADAEIDAGADLLIAGDMGIGNTTAAAAVIGVLTRWNPAKIVGRGTGIDDTTWMRKTAAVRDGMFRARDRRGDPLGALAAVGGADVAAMTGFLLAAAARGVPVILDGMVISAAALAAHTLSYRAREWWLAGHRSVEPAHTMVLERLRLTPLLDLQMRLGEGSGALVALPILQAAAGTLTEMATFDSAGVSDRTPPDAAESPSDAAEPTPDASEPASEATESLGDATAPTPDNSEPPPGKAEAS